jgi:uncharacterized protein Smg (DUF494 family)
MTYLLICFIIFRPKDPVDIVFDLIRTFADPETKSLSRNKLGAEAQQRGLSDEDIAKCLERYPDVLMYEDGEITLTL